MSQFILNYQGNKLTESKYLVEVDFDKYDTIVECFGGSFGFIRYLYNVKKLKNKKYIVYDFDKELIDFYNHFKNLKEERPKFIKEYNDLNADLFKLFKTGKDNSQINLNPTLHHIKQLDINKNMKYLLVKNITTSFISRIYNKKKLINLDIFDNIEFRYNPIQSIDFNQFDKETPLFYLDPPYLFEKSFYNEDDGNAKSLFTPIIYLFKKHFKVMFIHSYNTILEYILKEWTFMEYIKRYGNTGKQVLHKVYYNF